MRHPRLWSADLKASSGNPDTDYLSFVSEYIDSISDTLRPINLRIHDHPESKWKEVIAHETLVSFLQTQKGWTVTPSAYDMPTAFVAVYDSGKKGPVISFNAEYDALPGIGHACGHNLISTSSLAAALASAATIAKYDLAGKVVLFGTPAEEGGGGKIKLLERGAYTDNNVDVSLMGHGGNVPDHALVRTAAYLQYHVEYFGQEAHAGAMPWEGINALDALVTAYNSMSVLRQQIMPNDRLMCNITHGGALPNVIHAYAAGRFIARSDSKARIEVLAARLRQCLEAGAVATGAKLKFEAVSSYDDHMPNWTMGALYRKYFTKLGGEIPIPELDSIQGMTSASTDQGNISYAMPSLHIGFCVPCDVGPHNPGFEKVTGTMKAHLICLRAAKALAATGLEILTKEGLVDDIKAEWKKSIENGGPDGRK